MFIHIPSVLLQDFLRAAAEYNAAGVEHERHGTADTAAGVKDREQTLLHHARSLAKNLQDLEGSLIEESAGAGSWWDQMRAQNEITLNECLRVLGRAGNLLNNYSHRLSGEDQAIFFKVRDECDRALRLPRCTGSGRHPSKEEVENLGRALYALMSVELGWGTLEQARERWDTGTFRHSENGDTPAHEIKKIWLNRARALIAYQNETLEKELSSA